MGRSATVSAPLVEVDNQAVLPWLLCEACSHQGLAGTPAQGSGMLCSRGIGRRTGAVSFGKCNGGRPAQAGAYPFTHKTTAATLRSPLLATPPDSTGAHMFHRPRAP